MAILQLSRITHRKGLMENLPQLAGAEFGWVLDERRLFIGNGTLEDGAPVIGNTEILTEFSDILALSSTYTYKGEAAGYVVSTGPGGTDVVRSLQSKFDDIASIKDFGAKGDGVTDDTDAINRAFYEIFCREVNAEIRRSLFFPAGIYIVSQPIKIPTYAKIFGEGINSSIIRYQVAPGDPVFGYVAITSDSQHQIEANIGNNGAILPTGIEVQDISFETTEDNTILRLNSTTHTTFERVEFKGSLFTTPELINAGNENAAIEIVNSTSNASENINFDKVVISGTSYGLKVVDPIRGIRLQNGRLSYLHKGCVIGDATDGPSGVNISRNIFDKISAQGIHVINGTKNSSMFNVFYDVGNSFGTTPTYPVVQFDVEENVSVGDLFERNDADNLVYARIEINGLPSIAYDSAKAIKLGVYERQTGLSSQVPNNTTAEPLFTLVDNKPTTFKVDYSIRRNPNPGTEVVATGSLIVTNDGASISYVDDFVDSGSTGVDFNINREADVVPGGDPTTTIVAVDTNDLAADALINFSIVRLDYGTAP